LGIRGGNAGGRRQNKSTAVGGGLGVLFQRQAEHLPEAR
jgi:hypothetical protein